MSRTREEMRAMILAAPAPLTTKPASYNEAGLCAAKAMLIVCEENPTLLNIPEDKSEFERASHDAHWKAACERWPGLDDWLGGITGFMFGWATTQVRWLMGREQVGNPAVLTVKG